MTPLDIASSELLEGIDCQQALMPRDIVDDLPLYFQLLIFSL
jgi:hypothetical protein